MTTHKQQIQNYIEQLYVAYVEQPDEEINIHSLFKDVSFLKSMSSSLLHVSLHDRSDASFALSGALPEKITPIAELIQEYIDKKKTSSLADESVTSGYSDIDRITLGFPAGGVSIIGGRPAMGKTAFMLNCMLKAAEQKVPVAFFSLELSTQQIAERLISISLHMGKDQWRPAIKDDSSMDKNLTGLSGLPIYFNDKTGLSLFRFREHVEDLVKTYNVKAVFVDYIQLMCLFEDKTHIPRERELGLIMLHLKKIARALNIAIIVSSSLSRAVESRPGCKRPILSDLRESGSLEQDADLVMLLYRYEYYGLMEDESGMSTEGLMDVIIAKNRYGATGTVRVGLDRPSGRILEPQFFSNNHSFFNPQDKMNLDF